VNAYEGKAGMVLFADETVWSICECFETMHCINDAIKIFFLSFSFFF